MNRQTVVGKGSAEIKVYKGKSVFEGIAIGKIRLIKIKNEILSAFMWRMWRVKLQEKTRR